jgi:hypothetical protein
MFLPIFLAFIGYYLLTMYIIGGIGKVEPFRWVFTIGIIMCNTYMGFINIKKYYESKNK